MSQLIWVYAIVEAETPAHQLLREGRVPGLAEGEPLFPVELSESGSAGQRQLVAAVSQVPSIAFSQEALDALLGNLQLLAPYALRHEEAIRALLPAAPALIPLSFGVVFREPERVTAFLAEQSGALRPALDQVRDREEWGVKVFREAARFREAVEATSDDLQRLAQETRGATPGRAYLLRKQRERRIGEEVERETDRVVAALYGRLSEAAAEARAEPIPAEAASDLQAMVLKAAFLVDRSRAGDFAARYSELSDLGEARGLRLELTGPWAPYSFVGISR